MRCIIKSYLSAFDLSVNLQTLGNEDILDPCDEGESTRVQYSLSPITFLTSHKC